ncbi:hypothetical protein [Desertivirga arenae]|uniref:hypothetical protein n=1 Tax=Desertivirga arenae TaxID=2810309 RepID=UPI001A96AB55|nr:hypothetical protein [Pedobacter sp. SYSU D00823]
MNSILLNAAIAFGMLSVIIIPLYIASRSSQRNKINTLSKALTSLAEKESFVILREKFIGDKAFGFTENQQVIIVVEQGQEVISYILDNKFIESVLVTEKNEGGRLVEIKLIYQESGRRRDISLYRAHREASSDLNELRKISNEIKQFLN